MKPRKFINMKFFTRIIFNVKISQSTVLCVASFPGPTHRNLGEAWERGYHAL